VARDRNIQIHEVRHELPADFQTMVRLSVVHDDTTQLLSGTVIAGHKPRLVEVQGISLEAELGRHMLYLRNRDKPGLIGGVGTLLGEMGVNIATFHLGRSAPGADAIMLCETDQPVDGAMLDRVRAVPNVIEAMALAF
jgi:D-3-phosphoglycerate dehydrogenase